MKVISIFIDDILRETSGKHKELLTEFLPEKDFSTIDIFKIEDFFDNKELFNDFLNNNIFDIVSGADAVTSTITNDFLNLKQVLNGEGYKIRIVFSANGNRIGMNLHFLTKLVLQFDELVVLNEDTDITEYTQDFIVTTNYNIKGDNVILVEKEYNKEFLNDYKFKMKEISELPKIVFSTYND